MYLCIAPLSRFYYPETRRFINAFFFIIIISRMVIFNAKLVHGYDKTASRYDK